MNTIQLWRCPECGSVGRKGEIEPYCGGYGPTAHDFIDRETVTYIPLDEVLELIEGAAGEMRDRMNQHQNPVDRKIFRIGAQNFRALGTKIKNGATQ